jgi:hypothetical protein
MHKLEQYRRIILDLLNEYRNWGTGFEEIETFTVVDREGDHYQILRDGWRNKRRFYGCVLHLDIKGGKVWVRHDGTEQAIAERLVERGVPREDIVLGFHAPELRQFTEFAIA